MYGQHPNAKFTTRTAAGPMEIVKSVLGEDWWVVPESFSPKPLRCIAQRGSEQHTVIWGSPEALSSLVWSAILAKAEKRPDPVVALLRPAGDASGAAERARLQAIAEASLVDIRLGILLVGMKELDVSGGQLELSAMEAIDANQH